MIHVLIAMVKSETSRLLDSVQKQCRISNTTHKIVCLGRNQSFGFLLIDFRLFTSRYLFLNRMALGVTCIVSHI